MAAGGTWLYCFNEMSAHSMCVWCVWHSKWLEGNLIIYWVWIILRWATFSHIWVYAWRLRSRGACVCISVCQHSVLVLYYSSLFNVLVSVTSRPCCCTVMGPSRPVVCNMMNHNGDDVSWLPAGHWTVKPQLISDDIHTCPRTTANSTHFTIPA